jgi:hypothetical protein
MATGERAGRRTRRRWLALAAAVLIVAGSGCKTHKPDSPEPTDAASAGDGGQIRVIESGFHMTPTGAPAETNRAIAAVIVENTSKTQEAQTTELNLRFLDASGAPVFTFGSPDQYRVKLPWILPGQRIGVGYILATDEKSSANRTVATMQAEIGQSSWRSPHTTRRVTMSDVHIQPRPDGGADLRYVATLADATGASASDRTFRVYLLLRDSTGKLIGGWPVGNVQLPPNRSNGGESYTAEDWKKNVPADADLDRSELYGAYGIV